MSTEPHYTDALAIADQQLSNALKGAMWEAVQYKGEDFTDSLAWTDVDHIYRAMESLALVSGRFLVDIWDLRLMVSRARMNADSEYGFYADALGVI